MQYIGLLFHKRSCSKSDFCSSAQSLFFVYDLLIPHKNSSRKNNRRFVMEKFLKIMVWISFMVIAVFSLPLAAGGERVALVIGNKDYEVKGLPDLDNTINDALDMKAALELLDFKVIYRENAVIR
jgi:hypothetical protein